jgi:tricorn protease
VTVALGSNAGFTPDGREILYIDPNGRLNYVPAPTGIFSGRNVPFTATREVSLREEMLKAFDEAHSSFGDAFYDEEFHGRDWEALGRQYRALVATAKTREEFLFYLNRMVGQVSASHTGASANTVETSREATGFVGMELVPEPMPGNRMRLRVAEIDRGGPADRAWIREGDYIFRIDRHVLSIRSNFYEHLDGKIGQEVSLWVADNPEAQNVREVKITPESHLQRRQRLYRDYVVSNKQQAAQRTRGAVAYIHLPGMMPNNFAAFQNELASQQVQRSRALIIDVRDNGGGNIHQQLIDLLSRRPYAYMTLRNGRRINQPTVYWDRPIAILINERSYSDAEVFPHAMKVLDMATVIGVPTPGAVIGTRNIRLSDGTSWRLPQTGFYNWDGTIQERNGCEPHILVEVTPEDVLAGRDPQFDKALEVLAEQLRRPSSAPSTEDTPEQPAEPEREADFLEPAALPWLEEYEPVYSTGRFK